MRLPRRGVHVVRVGGVEGYWVPGAFFPEPVPSAPARCLGPPPPGRDAGAYRARDAWELASATGFARLGVLDDAEYAAWVAALLRDRRILALLYPILTWTPAAVALAACGGCVELQRLELLCTSLAYVEDARRISYAEVVKALGGLPFTHACFRQTGSPKSNIPGPGEKAIQFVYPELNIRYRGFGVVVAEYRAVPLIVRCAARLHVLGVCESGEVYGYTVADERLYEAVPPETLRDVVLVHLYRNPGREMKRVLGDWARLRLLGPARIPEDYEDEYDATIIPAALLKPPPEKP